MAIAGLFVQRVKSILVPELKVDAFAGRFPTFRRQRGDLIHEVSVQGWRYGGERTVNLSFGFTFIQPGYSNPNAPQMEYSYRIGTLGGNDRWWRYEAHSEVEVIALADDMIAVYRTEAPGFFERFSECPAAFAQPRSQDGMGQIFPRFLKRIDSIGVRCGAMAQARHLRKDVPHPV